MRLVAMLFLLLAACVAGEDASNCNAIACGGCCGVGGRCESGEDDRACGGDALACIDCTRMGLVCNGASQRCVAPGTCGALQCNTGNGTATPCCPLAFPCASGTQCFSRANAPAGARCCP
ncbi:MAG: hypothetical protein JNK82_11510 [Myxococcaceae bacterium]|nr:hypothetical protein [Myxococcaceae bacterium]